MVVSWSFTSYIYQSTNDNFNPGTSVLVIVCNVVFMCLFKKSLMAASKDISLTLNKAVIYVIGEG